MALEDFTGQRIQETYQRLVQTSEGKFADGVGNNIFIVTADQTASFARKSEISGAFKFTSASLESRLITIESELNNTLISGSTQIASEISGAFGEVSNSIHLRLNVLEATEDHLHDGTVSGSIQIATEISGAFTAVSTSFSSRLTTAESELGNTLISGSAQIATEISGAFHTVSHSLQNRVATLESTEDHLHAGNISGSSQIATEISGAFASVSHSLQNRITTTVTNTTTNSDNITTNLDNITTNSNNITSLTNATSSYLLNTTDTLIGDLTVTGKITAEEFHTEFVTSSVIFASGSSRIGNSSDDTHQFTGSVFISGSSIQLNGVNLLPFTDTGISGSFTLPSESFASRLDNLEDNLEVTATSISESLGTNASVIRSLTRTSISQSLGTNASVIRSLTRTAISGAFFVTSKSISDRVKSLESNAVFTSAIISGSFTAPSESFSTRVTSLESTTSNRTFNQITVSNDISASGKLFFSSSLNSNTALKTLMYDTVTGQIFHTGSYGGGGGSGGGGGTGAGFPFSGSAIITGSLIVSGARASEDVTLFADVVPGNTDEYTLGTSTKKWNAVFATNTFFGGIHEINLETTGISQLQTGTILVSKAGQMVPCDTKGDALVMGVVTSGSDYPVVMGAEPVLVDGPVYEGDYIITGNRKGYGIAIAPDKIYEQRLFGKIIAQSLETNLLGGSVKAMIRKM